MTRLSSKTVDLVIAIVLIMLDLDDTIGMSLLGPSRCQDR